MKNFCLVLFTAATVMGCMTPSDDEFDFSDFQDLTDLVKDLSDDLPKDPVDPTVEESPWAKGVGQFVSGAELHGIWKSDKYSKPALTLSSAGTAHLEHTEFLPAELVVPGEHKRSCRVLIEYPTVVYKELLPSHRLYQHGYRYQLEATVGRSTLVHSALNASNCDRHVLNINYDRRPGVLITNQMKIVDGNLHVVDGSASVGTIYKRLR